MATVKALQSDYEELLMCNKMAVADLQSLLAYLDELDPNFDVPDTNHMRHWIQKAINVLQEDN